VGVLGINDVNLYGLSGVLARCVGLKRDLRLSHNHSYSGYNSINFKSFLGVNGDTYDRYLIRMLEMGESLNIINSICTLFFTKYSRPFSTNLSCTFLNSSHDIDVFNSYTSMEDLISHFIN
jgi:NADH:ubiquinone oxidoreductase subunit D